MKHRLRGARPRAACSFRGAADDAWCARVERKAREMFGETDNPHEAGYIMPDGAMLDFSGKRGGRQPYNHTDIGRATGQGAGFDAMHDFMRRCCAIRFTIVQRGTRNSAAVEGHAPCRPTSAQKRAIRDVEPFVDGFYAELTGGADVTLAYAMRVGAREAIDVLTPANGGLAGSRRCRRAKRS